MKFIFIFFLTFSFIKAQNLKDNSLKDSLSKKLDLINLKIESNKKLFEKEEDRFVFYVENISTVSLTTYELIQLIPNLKIDNNRIILASKDNISFMINEKLIKLNNENLINYLNSIPGNNIKKIELITNPSAKYSSEGIGGIVNIILKKNINDSFGIILRSSYSIASKSTYNQGINISYKKNKLLLQTDINYINGYLERTNYNNYKPLIRTDLYKKAELGSQAEDHNKTLNTRLDLEYIFSKKLTSSLQYIFNSTNIETKDGILSNLILFREPNIERHGYAKGITNPKIESHSINFNSIYKIDSLGNKINFDLDFFSYKNNLSRIFDSWLYVGDNFFDMNNPVFAENINNQDIKNYSARIDVETPLNFININYGLKLSFSDVFSDLKYYNTANNLKIYEQKNSDEFDYKENIQALYFSTFKKINKVSFRLGARAERTYYKGISDVLGTVNNQNYIKIFPNANFLYNPNDRISFSLGYSQRINRPNYVAFNPFSWYLFGLARRVGNPNLNYSTSNNYELNIAYKKQLNTKVYFTNIKDGFDVINNLNINTTFQEFKPYNFHDTKIIGLTQNYNLSLFNNLYLYNVANIYYSDSKGLVNIVNSRMHGWATDFSITSDYSFNKAKTVILNLKYLNVFNGVKYLNKFNNYDQVDVALKLLFLNKNLQISLLGTDIFKGTFQETISYSNDIEIFNRNYSDRKSFRISLIYNLGNNKIKQKTSNSSNEEEKVRTK